MTAFDIALSPGPTLFLINLIAERGPGNTRHKKCCKHRTKTQNTIPLIEGHGLGRRLDLTWHAVRMHDYVSLFNYILPFWLTTACDVYSYNYLFHRKECYFIWFRHESHFSDIKINS